MPTKKGIVLIIISGVCYLATAIFNVPAFLYIAGMLMALLIFDFLWLWLTCFGISCGMTCTSPVQKGEDARLRFTVNNQWPLPRCGVTVWLTFPPGGLPAPQETLEIRSLPRSSTTYHNMFVECERRGKFELHDVYVRYAGALGFTSTNRHQPCQAELEVQPAGMRLSGFPLLQSGQGYSSSETSQPKPGLGNEFYAVRPYTSGDNPRSVHWLSTLRARQLMTRQYEALTQKRVIIVLDCLTGFFASQKTTTDFETAVTVTASLAKTAYHTDHAVGLLMLGVGRELIEPAPGVEKLRRILSELTHAEQKSGSPSETDIRQLTTQAASIVFITSAPDPICARILTQLRSGNQEIHVVLVDSTKTALPKHRRRIIEQYRDFDIRVDRVREGTTVRQDLNPDSHIGSTTV